MEETLIKEIDGDIVRLRFNRPDSLSEIKADATARVVIVSGEGRAFSAGVDLKTTEPKDFQKDAPFMMMGKELPRLIASMPQVIIAQVHGYCFTGALEFMLCFDLMFCDDDTQFGDTHTKWSIIPQWGMTQRLGPEAERIGLVNRSFAKAELTEEVDKIAQEISANGAEAISRMKQLYDQGYAGTLIDGLELEANADTQMDSTSEQLSQFDKKKFSS